MLEVRLLGRFDIQLDGRLVEIRSRPAQSLLAYLLLHSGAACRREQLAGLLWPDAEEPVARRNLRQALWQIRHALEPNCAHITVNNITISFNEHSSYWLDASELSRPPDGRESTESLTRAVSAYGGELLPGFYDDWVNLERERLRATFERKMQQLLERLVHDRRWPEVMEWSECWLALGTAPEVAYQALMIAHAGLGEAASVAADYQRCVQALEHQLAVQPSERTQTLFKQLQQGGDSLQRAIQALHSLDAPTLQAPATPTEPALLERIAQGRLVARERELAEASAVWRRVLAGEGQVLLVSGEPGIGKTRLVQELIGLTKRSGARVLASECYPESSAPLAPIAAIAAEAFHNGWVTALHLPAQTLNELRALVPDLRADPADPPSATQLDPQSGRQRLFEAIVGLASALADQTPLVVSLDDVHWADSLTLDLLRHLARRMRPKRLLIVATYREGDVREGDLFGAVLTDLNRERLALLIRLAPLERPQIGDLLTYMFAGDVTPEFRDAVYNRTEGNPFFTEELCKALIESRTLVYRDGRWQRAQAVEALAVPQTVRAAIQARVSQLPARTQAALRNAAILGREFDFDTLRTAGELDEDALIEALEAAVRAQLVSEVPGGPAGQVVYRFEHALIPSTLSDSLSGPRRRRLHQQVAAAIEALRPGNLEALAYHYLQAGASQKAVDYLLRAARKAMVQAANLEAIAHLNNGLSLLKDLPNSPEHLRQELDLQTALGTALMAVKGYAAPDVERAYRRARELCEQVGETPGLFPVLWGLWNYYEVSGRLRTARELAEQLLALAEAWHEPPLLLEAHRVMGDMLSWLGELSPARTHCEQALQLYDPREHLRHITMVGEDPGVCAGQFLAFTLWLQGHPDQSAQRMQAAIALAERLDHPFSRAQVLGFENLLALLRHEAHTIPDQVQAMLALSQQHNFELFSGWGRVFLGRTMAEAGQPLAGVDAIREGLRATEATGAVIGLPYLRLLLAEAYALGGRVEAALNSVNEALALAEAHEEHWCESELWRRKGEWLLIQPVPDFSQAEACLRQAYDHAHRRSILSLELRAASGLVRLSQTSGDRQKWSAARRMLADTLGRFEEGFGTPDWIEAEGLLLRAPD